MKKLVAVLAITAFVIMGSASMSAEPLNLTVDPELGGMD